MISQQHNQNTFIYTLSTLLERAAYYGFRALIVLYLIGEVMGMERDEVFEIHGSFILSILFSQIIGALLGDLVIGNRRALFIGGILQTLGILCFLQPSLTFVYIGIGLISLGNGLYIPNFSAEFGKNYLDKQDLLDAGFTINYAAINIGALIGVALVGYIGEFYDFVYGFFVAGLFSFASTVLLIFSKKTNGLTPTTTKFIESKNIYLFLIFVFSIGLFWLFYDKGSIKLYNLEYNVITLFSFQLPNLMFQSINSYFVMGLSILAAFLWTFYYSNQASKLILGFLFTALGFSLLFLIP